jgi:DNA helicase-2/ATP-dependent DNA helicase PcrA
MTGERNNLILSSIHQSKGLEFDIVFLLFLDFGTMPYRATDDITEEKRLFYVGITRPRNALYLVSSKERVSPFLEDLDQNLISET